MESSKKDEEELLRRVLGTHNMCFVVGEPPQLYGLAVCNWGVKPHYRGAVTRPCSDRTDTPIGQHILSDNICTSVTHDAVC
jgi:hypothetical protein